MELGTHEIEISINDFETIQKALASIGVDMRMCARHGDVAEVQFYNSVSSALYIVETNLWKSCTGLAHKGISNGAWRR